MPLPDDIDLLCIAIKDKAKKEAEKIISDAKERAEHIISTGTQEIKRELEAQKLALKRKAYQEAKKKTDSAQLEARRLVMRTREEIFTRVMDMVHKNLSSFKRDPEAYKKMLHAMIEQAASVIAPQGGKNLVVLCNDNDFTLVNEVATDIASKRGIKVSVSKEEMTSEGGVMVLSEDRTMVVDLSFEAISSRIEPKIRSLVAKTVFAGGEQ